VSTVELELRVAWQRHIGNSHDATAWFDTVLDHYRGPGRHYHDVRHVGWVVRHVIALSADHQVDDLDAVVAAAFFHDVIYVPANADNEAASAALAWRALDELGWTPERCGHVADLVNATAGHHLESADRDTCLLIAGDLAVLAAEPARYGDYATAVRREYSHVDAESWRTGRGRVLRSLLDRPHLFPPSLELDDWERRARANLTAELASLSSA
jgi:predicted metal-dependent HD superfamily phosphohydrolase